MQLRIKILPLTRILLALLVTIAVTHQLTRYIFHGLPVELLALVPQQSIFYPWTYITAVFAEQNPVGLLIAGASILYGGGYLERAWGSSEFGKFVIIVTMIPNIIACTVYVLWFAITREPARALAYIQGSVALQGAFLVAFKQLVPEHTVSILHGIVKIRVKHFPAIFLGGNTLSGILIGTDTALVLGWAGFLTSWVYLRFYKKQSDLSSSEAGGPVLKGDASETFAFAYFWPDVIQPAVAVMADAVYNVMVAIHVLTPFPPDDVETGNVQASERGEAGLPTLLSQGRRGGKREEAERRRKLALKVLDQRLQVATQATANRQQQQSTPPADQPPAPSPDAPRE